MTAVERLKELQIRYGQRGMDYINAPEYQSLIYSVKIWDGLYEDEYAEEESIQNDIGCQYAEDDQEYGNLIP